MSDDHDRPSPEAYPRTEVCSRAEALTLTEAAAAVRAGRLSAATVVGRALVRADAQDAALGVFVTRFPEQSRVRAAAVDAEVAAGRDPGPLAGMPVGVKDIITDVQGPTTAQSLVDPRVPQEDAVVVRRLKAAGAVVVGKTTTMEYAFGNPDTAKPFPVPRNPWDTQRWAGGSSSGSGSGVAAGMFLGALGTDTAGSIRIPAAYCGVTGLMPTFGRVPRSGVVPLAPSLDHVGPLARSAADCALLLSVVAGPDPSDPEAADEPVDDYVGALTGDLTGVRIGVDDLDRFAADGIDPEQPSRFAAALAVLRDAGATLVDVEVPRYLELSVADVVTCLYEARAFHRTDLESRYLDFAEGFRTILTAAAVLTPEHHAQALAVAARGREDWAELTSDVDLVVTPSAHLGATLLTELAGPDPRRSTRSLHCGYFNPLGVPVLAVPIGLSSEDTPLSLSIAGRPFDEATVLRAGDALQRRTDHHLTVPVTRAEATRSESATVELLGQDLLALAAVLGWDS